MYSNIELIKVMEKIYYFFRFVRLIANKLVLIALKQNWKMLPAFRPKASEPLHFSVLTETRMLNDELSYFTFITIKI